MVTLSRLHSSILVYIIFAEYIHCRATVLRGKQFLFFSLLSVCSSQVQTVDGVFFFKKKKIGTYHVPMCGVRIMRVCFIFHKT